MLSFSAVAVDFREAERRLRHSQLTAAGGWTSWCAQPMAELLYSNLCLLDVFISLKEDSLYLSAGISPVALKLLHMSVVLFFTDKNEKCKLFLIQTVIILQSVDL